MAESGSWRLSALRRILLEPVILLYMLSIWMQFNLMQPLLNFKICLGLISNAENATLCERLSSGLNGSEELLQQVHRRSSSLLFYSNLCLTIPSILVAPFLGILGDRFGRKLAVILPAIGALLSAINYLICAQTAVQPEMLVLSNLLQGLCGGFTGCILGVSSWASVICSRRVRTSRLAFIEFANLIGTAIAPVISGVLAKYSGYGWAFGLAGSLNILLLLYVVFFLQSPQEADEAEMRRSTTWSVWHPRQQVLFLGHLFLRDPRGRLAVSVAFVCLFFTWTVSTGTNEIRYNFLETLGLKWDVLKYNLFVGDEALVRGVTLVTVVPVLKQYFGAKDSLLIFAGLLSKGAMLVFLAYATTTLMVFLVPVVGFMAAVVSTCGRSLASKALPKSHQGRLFALLGIVENVASLTGSGIFQKIYTDTSAWFAGFPYVLGAILLILPALLLIVLHRALFRIESFLAQNHQSLHEVEEDGEMEGASDDNTVVNGDLDRKEPQFEESRSAF